MNTDLFSENPFFIGKDGKPVNYPGRIKEPWIRKTLNTYIKRLQYWDWLNANLWPAVINVIQKDNTVIYSFAFEYKTPNHIFHIKEFDSNFENTRFFKTLPLVGVEFQAKKTTLDDVPVFIMEVIHHTCNR